MNKTIVKKVFENRYTIHINGSDNFSSYFLNKEEFVDLHNQICTVLQNEVLERHDIKK